MSKSKNKITPTNTYPEIEKKQELSNMDYSALFFLFTYLVIDFLPAFGSVDIAGTQYLYLALLNIAIGIYIYRNPKLVSEKLIGDLKKSYFVKLYAVFLLFCLISVFIARNFSLSIISYSQLLITGITSLNLILLFSNRLYLIYKIAFLIGIFVFLESLLACNELLLSLKSGDALATISKLYGNTGNINIFAASLAIKLPFLFLGILYFSNWKKWFLAIAAFLSVCVIIVVYARASYITIVANCLLFIVFVLFIKNKEFKKSSLIPIIVSLVFGFIIGSWMLKKSNSTQNVLAVETNSSIVLDESANLRIKFWENAGQQIKQNPFIGIGIGNWRIESIPYEKKVLNNSSISQHPHNDFIEITTETGIINGLVFLSLFLILLLINVLKVLKSKDKTEVTVAFIAFLIIFDYCVDSFFNFPLYRATMQIMLGLGVALTLINTKDNAIVFATSIKNKLVIFSLIIGIICLYFSFTNYKSLCLENKIKADAILPEEQRVLTSEEILKSLPKFPNVCSTSEPFYLHAGIYCIKEKNYAAAEKFLNISEKINPYTGLSQWYKYRICKEKKQTDSAYIYAKRAFELRPRNKDYFTSLLIAASDHKDTTEIFRVHKLFSKYLPMSSNWITTSSALAISNFPIEKNIKFIEEGLKLFPNDALLLERKESFNNDLNTVNGVNSDKPNASIASKNSHEDLLQLAQKEANNSNFMRSAQYYQEYLTYDENNLNAKLNAGVCFIKASKYLKAIPYLKDVYKSNKVKDGSIEYFLAVCYSNTNQHDKGCTFLNIAKSKKYPVPASTFEASCK